MEKLKLISAKIDADTLYRLDLAALKLRFVKRNHLINAILSSVMAQATDEELMKMCRYWKHDSNTLPIITITGGR